MQRGETALIDDKMPSAIGILMPNELELDETAVNMPITVYDKPIGYIMSVDDKKIGALIWTKDLEVNMDADGRVLNIELMSDESDIWGMEC